MQELLKIYYTSVGRNSLLLLNVPPDNRGLIPAEDSLRLVEFHAALDSIFSHELRVKYITVSNYRTNEKNPRLEFWNDVRTCCEPGQYHGYWLLDDYTEDNYDTYWATDDTVTTAWVEYRFIEPQTFNRVLLQEYIPLGQRVEKFHIEVEDENGNWRTIAEETTIGYKRIVLTETVTTKKVRLVIDRSRASIVLNRFGLFMDNIFSE